jgi:hypothetical protein
MLTVRNFVVSLFFLLIYISPVQSSGQGVNSGTLKYPWAGGLNSCQYGSVDINLDGMNDLVIFDRHGNRILPFLNDGVPGLSGYSFHPEYADRFPDLHDWVIFTDYDKDGKNDLFSYSNGGIRVFRNTSDTILKFKLMTNLLESYYYSGKIGILVTLVEYPAIADIDNDGDLDILTFAALGSYVEYHKNLSMEKYGNADSLDYKLTENCWGDFKESEGGNKITLNITCPYKYHPLPGLSCHSQGSKHSGSTMLAVDLDENQSKDLILGDVDFPNLIALFNGGTPDSAHMISQDSTFPSNTKPVHLFSFPSSGFIDLNNDGKKDLIVSPFDPALTVSENFKSNWFYENRGTNALPDFQFSTDRFFQNEMIDVGSNSYPVIVDINGDGLTDLLVGNYGYYDTSYYLSGYLHSDFTSKIALYKNTGSTMNPSFQLQTDNFAGLSSLKLLAVYPTFGDLDGDLDIDMLIGNADGKLIFFNNTAGAGKTPVFADPQFNYQTIDVGDYSTPQLFDLDRDGLQDLIVGEQKGNINYYRNTGTPTEPQFSFITDSLGKVNVTNYNLSYDGFSTPFFCKDPSNHTVLFVGSEEGKVHFYNDIDNNLSGRFSIADSLLETAIGKSLPENPGWRTAVCAGNLTGFTYLDLIIGNYSGGLNYISNQAVPGVISSLSQPYGINHSTLQVYPVPADMYIVIIKHASGSMEPEALQIFDLLGRIVLETTIHDKILLNTTYLPQGTYLIRSGNSTQKLVILHP